MYGIEGVESSAQGMPTSVPFVDGYLALGFHGVGEKCFCGGHGPVDHCLRHAVVGDIEKAALAARLADGRTDPLDAGGVALMDASHVDQGQAGIGHADSFMAAVYTGSDFQGSSI